VNPSGRLAYMEVVRFVVVAILIAVATPASADRPRPTREQLRKKPSAPVDVFLESKAIAGGFEVRLVAIATRDVPAIELTLAGKTQVFGATLAGQRREMTTRVAVRAGDGLDVIGAAATEGRNRASVLRVGAQQRMAPKRSTTRTLLDGRQVEEVR
jgi:hypothetical protein